MTPSGVLYYYISPTIAVLTLLLNSVVVCILIRQYRRNKRVGQHRHSVPLIFLASLAISDFLVGLTVTVIKVISFLYHYELIRWSLTLGWVNHLMKYAFLRLSLLSSVFNLASLTVDRLLAIRFPMVYRIKVTNKQAFVVVGVTWLSSAMFAAAHYGITYFSGIELLQYDLVIFPAVVFPAALLFTICYSIILIEIRKQGRNMKTMMAGCCREERDSSVELTVVRGASNENTRSCRKETDSCHKEGSIISNTSDRNGDCRRYNNRGSNRDNKKGSNRDSNKDNNRDSNRASSKNIGCKIGINNNRDSNTYGNDDNSEIKIVKRKCDIRLSANDSRIISRINSTNSPSITEKSQQRRPLYMQRREIKIYRFAGTVVGLFLLCWLPIAVCGVVLMMESVHTFTMNFVFTLAFANSVFDPVVYLLFNDKVDGNLRRLFRWMCKFSCASEKKRMRKCSNVFSLSSGSNNSVLSKTRSMSSVASAETVL